MKHFFAHYDEELPPLWACVHLMTLGELIRWVQRLIVNVRENNAHENNT